MVVESKDDKYHFSFEKVEREGICEIIYVYWGTLHEGSNFWILLSFLVEWFILNFTNCV